MGVKSGVFASNTERRNYYKLSRQWGAQYRVYHNLPFLNVFTTSSLVDPETFLPVEVTPLEGGRVKKTSIDYTLCDPTDKPLVCIDFDGLNDGFNLGTRYCPERPADPWREQITELKLRIAHGSLFPYFVVGSQQFADLGPEIKLTIVDGIIGEIFSVKGVQERVAKGFNPEDIGMSQADFDDLTPFEQGEIVQDWLTGVEVDMDFEHNPIVRLSAELQKQANVTGWSWMFLEYPAVPTGIPLRERVRLLDQSRLIGVSATVTARGQKFERTVWLPNFKTPFFTGLHLLEELGRIAATLSALETFRKTAA